jgi:hypothetical protein
MNKISVLSKIFILEFYIIIKKSLVLNVIMVSYLKTRSNRKYLAGKKELK